MSRSRVSRSGRLVVPHNPKWFQRLTARAVFALERMLTSTLRWDWRDESGLFQLSPMPPVIYCIWHNRLALCMAVFRKHVRHYQPGRQLAALISASKDGALLACTLEAFGVQPVRGSTSRRGPQALLELTSLAERGYDIAITPDGPRGPRYVVQEGAVALAQVTQSPILPVTYYAPRKVCMKSWDAFQIPLPFSRCEMHIGRPISVPRHATDSEREALRAHLESQLRLHSRD